MTPDQIKQALLTNPYFAIGFVADNNFKGLNGNTLAQFGKSFSDRVPLRDFLVANLKSADWEKARQAVTMTKYFNDNTGDVSVYGGEAFIPKDYTLGYGEYFNSMVPGPKTKGFFNLDSLFTGLGAGLTAYAQSNQAAQLSQQTGQTVLTPAQIEQMKKEEDERLRIEAEERRQRMMTIALIGVGSLVLIIILVVALKSPKPSVKISAG